MLVLNALLGLGTVLAPVFVAVFVGLGFWWGLPILSAALLIALLVVSLRLPLHAAAQESPGARPGRRRIPARFWLYAAFVTLYGICETMNGNWSQLEMTKQLGASATQASLALAAFWGMVTIGRVLFGLIDRWLSERITYHVLPFVLVGAFVLLRLLPAHDPTAGIAVFGLAGLGCSALLPLTISFGEQELTAISAAVAGVRDRLLPARVRHRRLRRRGPCKHAGLSLSAIFGGTAIVAAALAVLSFVVSPIRPARHSRS